MAAPLTDLHRLQALRAGSQGHLLPLEVPIDLLEPKKLSRNKTFQIPSILQTSRKDGMITMDKCIQELLEKELITAEEAYLKAHDKKMFAHLIKNESQAAI